MKRRSILTLAAAATALGHTPFAAAIADTERTTEPPRLRPAGDVDGDDTLALQTALDRGGTVELEAGDYRVTRTMEIKQPGTRLVGRGDVRIIAKESTTDEYVLRARGVGNLAIENITVDANGSRRRHLTENRAVALALIDCTNSKLERVTAIGASGRPGHSGVGIAIGGVKSRRISIIRCKAIDCGAPARPSDGIYCSASDSLISDCVAENCFDTAFVLEKCSNSGIRNCVSNSCSAAAAITNTLDEAVRGNYIDGLTATNWQAKNTGGIQVGCLRPEAKGDLLETRIANVVLVIDRGDRGEGPAINVRSTATARVRDIKIENIKITGASRQGILISAENYSISHTEITHTVDACIQVQTGSERGSVRAAKLEGGSFGIVASDGGQLNIEDVSISGQTRAAIYLRGDSRLTKSGRNAITPSARGVRISTEGGASEL